jgi:hypothetical protein
MALFRFSPCLLYAIQLLSDTTTHEELVPPAPKEELVPLATKEDLVTLATKEELVTLATKEELVVLATKEDLAVLATKEELVPLATKEELVPLKDLLEKFDNIINVIAQLNLKLNNVCEKVSLLESSSVTESS